MPFTFKKTRLPDVLVVESKVFSDARGAFSELYKAADFKANGIDVVWVQVNRSYSKKNILRGLHYQLGPKAQDKLVSVVKGEIFDVAVDIRKGSSTFGQWVGEMISVENGKMIYVPAGFAHGFCVLSDGAEVVYYCSREYAPDLERTIVWNDPSIGIQWPVAEPVLSSKDSTGVLLSEAENNFEYRRPG